jgi:NADH-quinone oxidoreductase subunit C
VTEREIYSDLSARFDEKVLEFQETETLNATVVVKTTALAEVMSYLKSTVELDFDSLMSLSGVDRNIESDLEVIYHLYSLAQKHYITIRVTVARDNGVVPSVASIWRTADWHEREVFDMFGIRFDGHPDLKRILLEDDWEGFPLKKDYVAAETYRGMKIAKEK